MTNISNETNLIIQSACSAILFWELSKNNRLLESDFFKGLKFDFPEVKNVIEKQIGIDNQGMLLMVLYALLVIPKELLFEQFESDFEEVNKHLDTVKVSARSTYKKDGDRKALNKCENHIVHIRNAVAHGNVVFQPHKSVIFKDKDKHKGEEYEIEIPLSEIGGFLFETLIEIQKKYLTFIDK